MAQPGSPYRKRFHAHQYTHTHNLTHRLPHTPTHTRTHTHATAVSKTNGIGGGIKMAARPEKEKAKYIEKIKIIYVGHIEGEHTLPGVK